MVGMVGISGKLSCCLSHPVTSGVVAIRLDGETYLARKYRYIRSD